MNMPVKPKLLIVEDDEGLQRQLRWAYDDYEVLVAADRAGALDIVRAAEPAVVTLDLGLPPDPDGVSEGFAALETILSNSASRWSKVRRFESSSPSGMRAGSSTTAAATTGPASGPLPASSMPATGQRPWAIALVSTEKSGFSTISKRSGESERGRAMCGRLAPAPILRKTLPAGWGDEPEGTVGAGGQGRTGFRPYGGRAAAVPHSSINCSFFFAGGTNRSVRSVRRSRLKPRRLAAISKRRPICQA